MHSSGGRRNLCIAHKQRFISAQPRHPVQRMNMRRGADVGKCVEIYSTTSKKLMQSANDGIWCIIS